MEIMGLPVVGCCTGTALARSQKRCVCVLKKNHVEPDQKSRQTKQRTGTRTRRSPVVLFFQMPCDLAFGMKAKPNRYCVANGLR